MKPTQTKTQASEILLDEIILNGGIALLAAGKPVAAREQFEKALVLKPNDAYTLTNLGFAYEKEGKPRDAAGAYSRAIKADPLFSGNAYMGLMRTLPAC